MARWEDALDAQLEFVQRMRSNDLIRRLTRGWFDVEKEKDRLRFGQSDIDSMPDRLAIMAYNSDPVYVDPDMQTLWESAVDGFQPEPLMPQDLITPAGFLWLARPFTTPDIHGKATSTRAILWHPQTVRFVFEENKDSEEKVERFLENRYNRAVVRKIDDHQYGADGLMLVSLHLTSDTDEYTDKRLEIPGLTVQHVYPWTYGQVFGDVGERPVSHTVLAWQALWRMMQQTITSKSEVEPDRHTRKRLQKAEWPVRRITVIRLRRREPAREKADEKKIVDWTHRWVVEPYWRNQWYPSLGIHRQKLVVGHIKGPEGLPLVVRKSRVFNWAQ